MDNPEKMATLGT